MAPSPVRAEDSRGSLFMVSVRTVGKLGERGNFHCLARLDDPLLPRPPLSLNSPASRVKLDNFLSRQPLKIETYIAEHVNYSMLGRYDREIEFLTSQSEF